MGDKGACQVQLWACMHCGDRTVVSQLDAPLAFDTIPADQLLRDLTRLPDSAPADVLVEAECTVDEDCSAGFCNLTANGEGVCHG